MKRIVIHLILASTLCFARTIYHFVPGHPLPVILQIEDPEQDSSSEAESEELIEFHSDNLETQLTSLGIVSTQEGVNLRGLTGYAVSVYVDGVKVNDSFNGQSQVQEYLRGYTLDHVDFVTNSIYFTTSKVENFELSHTTYFTGTANNVSLSKGVDNFFFKVDAAYSDGYLQTGQGSHNRLHFCAQYQKDFDSGYSCGISVQGAHSVSPYYQTDYTEYPKSNNTNQSYSLRFDSVYHGFENKTIFHYQDNLYQFNTSKELYAASVVTNQLSYNTTALGIQFATVHTSELAYLTSDQPAYPALLQFTQTSSVSFSQEFKHFYWNLVGTVNYQNDFNFPLTVLLGYKTEHQNLIASFGTQYTLPTYNELSFNSDLDSEHYFYYQLQHQLEYDSFSLSSFVYYRDYQSKISWNLDNSGKYFPTNNKASDCVGFHVDLTHQLTNGVSLNASYDYLRHTFKESNKFIPLCPQHKIFVALQYQLQLKGSLLVLQPTYSYQATAYCDDANLKENSSNHKLDFSVTYQKSALQVGVSLNNILNQRFAYTQESSSLRTPGRSLNLTVKYFF